jgi:drug/metabolite transporter (DMT)-like permease
MTVSRARLVTLAFAAATLLAGANGVAIRFSNRELAPVWGAALRVGLAAVLLVFIMLALKLALPRGRVLLGVMLFGLVQFAGGFGFFYIALVQIPAGLGQTILALVPLATLLLAVAQRQERLRGTAVVGSLLGLAGVGLISLDPWRESIPPLALLAALASVLCFAQALVLIRQLPPIHPVALNSVGMVAGALVLLTVSVLLGEPKVIPHRIETWAAVAYVVVFGSVVAFLLHVYVAQNWGASRAAYAMVVIPLITITLSTWLEQEPITGGLLVGGVLVLGGVYLGALRNECTSRPPVEDPKATFNQQ